MTITCIDCGVTAELAPDRMPPGWTAMYHADYLDEFWCNRHGKRWDGNAWVAKT